MPKRSEDEKKLPAFDLKAARESKSLTQEECAIFLFASQPSIARWEREGSMPQIYRAYWNLYWQHNKVVKKRKIEKPVLRVVRNEKSDDDK